MARKKSTLSKGAAVSEDMKSAQNVVGSVTAKADAESKKNIEGLVANDAAQKSTAAETVEVPNSTSSVPAAAPAVEAPSTSVPKVQSTSTAQSASQDLDDDLDDTDNNTDSDEYDESGALTSTAAERGAVSAADNAASASANFVKEADGVQLKYGSESEKVISEKKDELELDAQKAGENAQAAIKAKEMRTRPEYQKWVTKFNNQGYLSDEMINNVKESLNKAKAANGGVLNDEQLAIELFISDYEQGAYKTPPSPLMEFNPEKPGQVQQNTGKEVPAVASNETKSPEGADTKQGNENAYERTPVNVKLNPSEDWGGMSREYFKKKYDKKLDNAERVWDLYFTPDENLNENEKIILTKITSISTDDAVPEEEKQNMLNGFYEELAAIQNEKERRKYSPYTLGTDGQVKLNKDQYKYIYDTSLALINRDFVPKSNFNIFSIEYLPDQEEAKSKGWGDEIANRNRFLIYTVPVKTKNGDEYKVTLSGVDESGNIIPKSDVDEYVQSLSGANDGDGIYVSDSNGKGLVIHVGDDEKGDKLRDYFNIYMGSKYQIEKDSENSSTGGGAKRTTTTPVTATTSSNTESTGAPAPAVTPQSSSTGATQTEQPVKKDYDSKDIDYDKMGTGDGNVSEDDVTSSLTLYDKDPDFGISKLILEKGFKKGKDPISGKEIYVPQKINIPALDVADFERTLQKKSEDEYNREVAGITGQYSIDASGVSGDNATLHSQVAAIQKLRDADKMLKKYNDPNYHKRVRATKVVAMIADAISAAGNILTAAKGGVAANLASATEKVSKRDKEEEAALQRRIDYWTKRLNDAQTSDYRAARMLGNNNKGKLPDIAKELLKAAAKKFTTRQGDNKTYAQRIQKQYEYMFKYATDWNKFAEKLDLNDTNTRAKIDMLNKRLAAMREEKKKDREAAMARTKYSVDNRNNGSEALFGLFKEILNK